MKGGQAEVLHRACGPCRLCIEWKRYPNRTLSPRTCDWCWTWGAMDGVQSAQHRGRSDGRCWTLDRTTGWYDPFVYLSTSHLKHCLWIVPLWQMCSHVIDCSLWLGWTL